MRALTQSQAKAMLGDSAIAPHLKARKLEIGNSRRKQAILMRLMAPGIGKMLECGSIRSIPRVGHRNCLALARVVHMSAGALVHDALPPSKSVM